MGSQVLTHEKVAIITGSTVCLVYVFFLVVAETNG